MSINLSIAPNSNSEETLKQYHILKDALLRMQSHKEYLINNLSDIEFFGSSLCNAFSEKMAFELFEMMFDPELFHITDPVHEFKQLIKSGIDQLCNIQRVFSAIGDKGYLESGFEFWSEEIAKKTQESYIKIHVGLFPTWLTKKGFRSILNDESPKTDFVRIIDKKIIEPTSPDKMRWFVNDVIKKKGVRVRNAVDAKANELFNTSLLKQVDGMRLSVQKDTRETATFYFQNGWVRIDPETAIPAIRPYSELKGYVWKSQILPHDFTPITDQKQINLCDFARFTDKVFGADQERIQAGMSAFCYLIHDFKDDALVKAVVAIDEKLVHNGKGSHGRTGKGIFLTKATARLAKTTVMEDINPNNHNRFAFERVKEDTKIIAIDEAGENFNFRVLFTKLTGDMIMEGKNKPEVSIPFERSPKFAICTNFAIRGEGASFEDRMILLEFSDFFGKDNTPRMFFGRNMFTEWDAHEYNLFFSFVFQHMTKYLQSGLSQAKDINVKKRRLMQATCPDFADFILTFDFTNDVKTSYITEQYNSIAEQSSYAEIDTVRKWIESYASIYNTIERNKSLKVWTRK